MEEMGERSIIGAEVMDRGRKLSGYERVKVNTSLGAVRFLFKEIGPHETSSVVDEDNQPARA